MGSPVISRVATCRPVNAINTQQAAEWIAARAGNARLVGAIAKGSRIERRNTAVGPAEIARLGTIELRNDLYRELAPPLAVEVSKSVTRESHHHPISLVVASSCTGYMVPGWDVDIVEQLCLSQDVVRLPLTQAGCSGGALALARAVDHVRLHPEASALAVSVELCSLAFHPDGAPDNLIASLIFGDGAGAALIEADTGSGLEVVASSSTLVPGSKDAIRFDLTNAGFYPRLALDLADVLVAPTTTAVRALLTTNGLCLGDLSFALLHPGGSRILDNLRTALGLGESEMRWSYESLRSQGNTSSAAIFDVAARYLADDQAPGGWGIIGAFGPGISIELLLVHRC